MYSNQIQAHFSFVPTGLFSGLCSIGLPTGFKGVGSSIVNFVLDRFRSSPAPVVAVVPAIDPEVVFQGKSLINYEAWVARRQAEKAEENSNEDYIVVPGADREGIFPLNLFV